LHHCTQSKQNKTKQTKTKQNKTKQNKPKQNNAALFAAVECNQLERARTILESGKANVNR